jgi:peptidoglycan hydrolase-like protein with peptidoglycan-binding domain
MKKVIKLKLSELKEIVKNTIGEQAIPIPNQMYKPTGPNSALSCVDTKLFNQKSGDGKMYFAYDIPNVAPNAVAERVVLYSDGTADLISGGKHKIGKWNCGTNGVEYRPDNDPKSVKYLGKIGGSSATQAKPKTQINTANCAKQLVDVIKDTTNKTILKFGCKTQGVKELQTLLGMEKPTGYFGNKTMGLVKKLQSEKNIKVDGVVGVETYPHIVKLGFSDGGSGSEPTQDSTYQFT